MFTPEGEDVLHFVVQGLNVEKSKGDGKLTRFIVTVGAQKRSQSSCGLGLMETRRRGVEPCMLGLGGETAISCCWHAAASCFPFTPPVSQP